MKKIILTIILLCLLSAGWFLISEIYFSEAQSGIESVKFEVKQGESVGELVSRLEDEQVIRNAWVFKKYIVWKGMDKKVNYGEFEVEAPVTLSRVAMALSQPGLGEDTITIIPGWNIRDIGMYFENLGKFQAEEITEYVGLPARNYKVVAGRVPKIELDLKILQDKPWYVSYEGYLAPETFRVYKNADVKSIIETLLRHRENQITDEMWSDIEKSGRTFFEILTMASILEREVQTEKDKSIVSDIFWRRYDLNWALQADSTVHYAVGKIGNVFTTSEDRDSNSPWNTYKYPGLPLGPISNPSLESIKAALYPEKNNDWYFLTDTEGVVYYAKDLNEHNLNRAKYIY